MTSCHGYDMKREHREIYRVTDGGMKMSATLPEHNSTWQKFHSKLVYGASWRQYGGLPFPREKLLEEPANSHLPNLLICCR